MTRALGCALAATLVYGCATFAPSPTSNASEDTVLTITRSGDFVTLSWHSRPGRLYTVVCRDSLGAGSWRPLESYADMVGTGGYMTAEDRVPPDEQRYYKLLAQPATLAEVNALARDNRPRARQPLQAPQSVSDEEGRIPPSALPAVTWPLENIAVADLASLAVSSVEARTLTERLHSALVRPGYFNVLSHSEMKTILETHQFQKTDACDDSACLVEMGKILAVQKIVGGSVGKVGSTFSLSLRLVNVETGKTELTVDKTLKAEPDQLLDLVEQSGRELALAYAATRGGGKAAMRDQDGYVKAARKRGAFTIRGEVLHPGEYELPEPLTLIQAVAKAGGFSRFADPSRVMLVRGKMQTRVNVRLLEDRPEKDILIQPDDIISVPRSFF